jgi:glycerate 2-kinase
MTDVLLKSGADIHEINTLRKHLDRVKGGMLASRLYPASVHAFILSDVIGDRLDMIASGPTVPDPTTFQDALDIIQNYDLNQVLPESIIKALENGRVGDEEETQKINDFKKLHVRNHLVGTNIQAALAAKAKANESGFKTLILTSHLVGKTCDVAGFLFSIIRSEIDYDEPIRRPVCLIFGGETTVEVKGVGKGGRNQDLVLHMVQKISDLNGVLFISLATDGEDGPTDAAGAVADAKAYREGAEKFGVNIQTFIDANDSYHYFQKLGGLIRIGSTGTNVNDLIIIIIDRV